MANINQYSVGIAFGDGPLVVNPTWTYLDGVNGLRVMEWTVNRGRVNELEKTTAGTATVVIADYEGVLDPTNHSSPYYPDVLPDCQAIIRLYDPVLAEWHTVFRGTVENYSFELRTITFDDSPVAAEKGVAFVTLELVDAFAWLNDYELMPYPEAGDTPPAGSEARVFYEDTAGTIKDRIDAILADTGWPAGLSSIFSGNVKATQTWYEPGTSALSALQDAADAEFPGVANLYVDKTGVLTFHGRQARFRPDVAGYGINRRDVGDPSATDSDSTIAPIAELTWELGKAFVFNSVLVLPQDATITAGVSIPPTDMEAAAQLDEDTTSIGQHGKKGLEFVDLLTLHGIATGNNALQETALFATYYRDNYAYPLPRITRMVFKSMEPSHRLAGALWKHMTRVEISDLLTVYTSHLGGGGFSEGYYVEGIRYVCRPANTRIHDVTLELDVSPQALFTSNPFEEDTDP